MTILDTFLSYQRSFFENTKKRKFLLSGRQLGKSHVIAGTMVFKALQRKNGLSLCISVNQRSASELLKKCKMYADAVRQMTSGKVDYTISFDSVKFSTGARVLSLPASSTATRGWTANCVCVDEAFFVPRLDEIMTGIAPTLTRDPDSELIIASSAGAKNSYAFKIWEQALQDKQHWHTQTVTVEDAIRDGLKLDLESLHSMVPDPQAFAQEYMCVFSQSMDQMLDPALLESYDALPQGTSGHWLGIDVGRTHDKTAIVQATGLNGTMYVEEITVLDKVEYSKQLEAVASLDKSKHFTGGYVDAGGIGSMLAEYVNKQVSSRIKPLSFTGANKTPMYEALRDLVFRQKVKFAKHLVERVKQDIQQVSRVVNASGEVRYQASRSEAGHADMTSAIVLCTEAFKKMPVSQSLPVSMPAASRLGAWRQRI